MAQSRQEPALIGYSEYIERKPLKFVDPIPASRICSACGNIPRLTYTLVCGHTFCQPCYESCATTSECVCPLDGDYCTPADVTSKEYPAEQLLRRKVHCWNEANGCCVVLPASQVADHVRQGCQHHVTRCPTCSAKVLSRDVCAHLKSRCAELALHAAPEAQLRAETTHFVGFEKKIDLRVRELDAKIARMSLEIASQSDKLVELCHNDNNMKEALTEQIGTASAQTTRRLDQTETQMKALVAQEKKLEERVGELAAEVAQLSRESGCQRDRIVEVCHNVNNIKGLIDQFGRTCSELKAFHSEQRESLMTDITSALKSVPSDQKTHQQVVKGYAALKKLAVNNGRSSSMSDKLYLRRYLWSWGILLKKEGDNVYLFLRAQLHEGKEDDFLDWPFKKELKLSIIHPKTRQEMVLCETPNMSAHNRQCYCRPIGASNGALYFGETRVDSSDIEGDGYIVNDQLLLRFEVAL